MSRYIDADKLWNDRPHPPRGQSQDYDKGFWDCIFRFSELIHKHITTSAADVVEVVRCKDCKHRNTPDCKMWNQCVICGDYHHWERDEYFCSYGERREK